MVLKKGRKVSGGRYIKSRKKKHHEIPGQKRKIKLGDEIKRKSKRTRGGNKKVFLLKTKFINVQTKNKSKRAEIKNGQKTKTNVPEQVIKVLNILLTKHITVQLTQMLELV